jgi:hypothetical protein
MDMPIKDNVYEHFLRGERYVVNALAHDESGEVVVVHTSMADGNVYTRSLSNFAGVLYRGEEIIPRFRLVG